MFDSTKNFGKYELALDVKKAVGLRSLKDRLETNGVGALDDIDDVCQRFFKEIHGCTGISIFDSGSTRDMGSRAERHVKFYEGLLTPYGEEIAQHEAATPQEIATALAQARELAAGLIVEWKKRNEV